MRRLARRLFTLCSAVSLLLCVAVCVLWVRSRGHALPRGDDAGEDGLSAFVRPVGARYTLRSTRGTLALYGPPRSAGIAARDARSVTRSNETGALRKRSLAGHLDALPAVSQTPEALAAALRNEQVVWEWGLPAGGPVPHFSPRGRRDTAAGVLAPHEPGTVDNFDPAYPPWRSPSYTLAQVARPVLAALEDPDRWVAAHVVLHRLARRRGQAGFQVAASAFEPTAVQDPAADEAPIPRILVTDGLPAEVRGSGSTWFYVYGSHGELYEAQACAATIEPAQRASLVARWHRRLDVEVVSAPHWQWFAACLVLPASSCLAVAGRHLLRRGRVERGLCPACGYDLRASPERCPECGLVSATRRSA